MNATRRPAVLALALASLLAACASASATPAPSGSHAPSEPASSSAQASASTPASAETAGWRQLTPAGEAPAPREDHTWTVTPDGATAYLFGGRGADGAALDDLWAYNLATDGWSRVDASGPPARFGHNAAWVEGIGLVVFAGQAGATFYDDLWAFDPSDDTWTQLPAQGDVPAPRYGSCAAVGPDGRLWISHGFTRAGQRFADTRAYDFTTGTWTDETPAADRPVERCLHACWWTGDGTLALFGGQTNGVTALGDLWQLSPGPRPGTNAWTRIGSGDAAPPRNLYAAVRLGPSTLVFGGQAADGSFLADVWRLADDGAALPVTLPGTAPPARAAAELIADRGRGRLLLFGGRDATDVFGDVWSLTLP